MTKLKMKRAHKNKDCIMENFNLKTLYDKKFRESSTKLIPTLSKNSKLKMTTAVKNRAEDDIIPICRSEDLAKRRVQKKTGIRTLASKKVL